ncbi:MAG: hypothetical protein CMJ34_00650 [Phycisphaerae bacterium]|nr:hypothetical protein [Phycisphaerae bacterium]
MIDDRPRGRRGLTLIESVIATAMLAVAVTAIFSALAAGQAHARVAADDLAGSVAAETLMERIIHGSTSTDPLDWNGHHESPGSMTDDTGRPLPGMTSNVGRRVVVERAERRLGDGPAIEGRLVRVHAFDRMDRDLVVLQRWMPSTDGEGS